MLGDGADTIYGAARRIGAAPYIEDNDIDTLNAADGVVDTIYMNEDMDSLMGDANDNVIDFP